MSRLEVIGYAITAIFGCLGIGLKDLIFGTCEALDDFDNVKVVL